MLHRHNASGKATGTGIRASDLSVRGCLQAPRFRLHEGSDSCKQDWHYHILAGYLGVIVVTLITKGDTTSK